MVLVLSEEQLKAAEAEATAQVEDAIEEISEEDLEGVAGGCPSSPHTAGLSDGTSKTFMIG